MQTCVYILVAASLLGLPKGKAPTVPGYDWASPKKRAAGPADPPPVAPSVVVDGFLKHLQTSDRFDAKQVAFLVEDRVEREDDDLFGFVDESLALISPKYRAALDKLDSEQVAKAADAFEVLSRSDDPYLAVAAANMAASAMVEREEIDRCLAMLDAVLKQHGNIEPYTTAADQFRFMRGYCQVHNLEYAEGYKTLEDFVKNHPESPERLRITARQILTELDRRAPQRIGDVRDIMNYARRKIANRRLDDTLLARQDEAVNLLEALIEEAEQQEQQNNNGQGEGGGDGGGGGNSQGNKPGQGASRSTLPQGSGSEGALRNLRAKPGEAWGKMPAREREQVLQTLQRRFPSQYRELLEQYYDQLAKDAPSQ